MAATNPMLDERTTPIRRQWMAVLGVVFLVTGLLVLIVTIGMHAFVGFAQSKMDERRLYGVTYQVEIQRAAERQQLDAGQRDEQGSVTALPIEEAMQAVARREGFQQPQTPPGGPGRTGTPAHTH